MTAQRLRKDQFVAIDGNIFQLRRVVTRQADGARAYQFEHPETGEIITKSIAEYEQGFVEGTIELAEDPAKALDPETKALLNVDFGSVPETMRKAAQRILPYVRGFHDRCIRSKSKKPLTKFINELAAEIGDTHPPAWNSLCRHLGQWEKAGTRDVRILVPKYHKRGPRQRQMHPFIQEKLTCAINEVYLTTSKNKAKHVRAALFEEVKRWNAEHGPEQQLACPALRTIQRAIKDIDQYTKALKRFGKAYADHHFKAVMVGPEAKDLLEFVEIDHTQVDLKVLDDETGSVLGRPWITAVIDRYSRCIVGFYIGFTPPSVTSVMMALRHMMTPKEYVKQRYPEVQSEYPCWGVPDQVICDHGAEFHSESLIEASQQLGFTMTYAPVGCPEFKGKIERFFRTANENVGHTVTGTAHPGVRDALVAKTAGETQMPFKVFVARFHRWVLDVYHRSVHEGIVDVPLRRWKEAEARREPRRPPSMKSLNALRPSDNVAITRQGIKRGRLRWNSQELQAIRTLPDFKAQDTVKIRINPDDVHTIEVIHPKSGQPFTVGPADPNFPTGITLFQWERAVSLANSRASGAVNHDIIMTTLNDLRIQADQLLRQKNRFHTKKVARFKNIGMQPGDFTPKDPADGNATPEPANEMPALSAQEVADPMPPSAPPAQAWATKILRKNNPSTI
ncbi:transposase family protein (plasmid) [Azospirillum oryzae]|uniref:Transposase family protein n=1 Tax=Azospirillum oryzae TaxID=286727 RepID=A0A6N1AEX6_9PROT|nr:DDE-type integrase/transposase/recombinase [Azospirillum oryzae]KAA0588758.1 transposase family protein [Azospirillum oryzae]QKS50106.1 transposase family protein [Azospirillum oryzae]GLR81373.1 hypothetical protein GCM10007856_40580 [Azospirillum oryzae]